MIFKEIKRNIFNKKFLIVILIFWLLLIMCFVLKKNNYYYELINYIEEYMKYYSTTYLNNINELIADNKIWIFIENDVINIYSATFLYFMTQNTIIFTILTLITPIIIFKFINAYLFDELYSNFFKIVIRKTKKASYIISRIFVSTLMGGLISLLPKLLYILVLNIFYVNGYSSVHYLKSSTFVPAKYLFFQKGFTPNTLLLTELLTTFLYGILIAFIAIIVISLVNRKILSYLVHIFIIFGQTLLAAIFSNTLKLNILTPFINMYTITDFLFYNSQNANILFVLLQYFSITISIGIVSCLIYKRKVENLM